MNILQISPRDLGGGAERVAWTLFQAYRTEGHGSYLAVGQKRSDDPDVLMIPNETAGWAGFWHQTALKMRAGGRRGTWRLSRTMDALAEPAKAWRRWRGWEEFDYPATAHLPELPPQRPDILHAHNLHIRYFDLRQLAALSGRLPVFLTLHDGWLLAGHCSHPIDCERWQTGCGACPDLTIYPEIRRDATAGNWRRKATIYQQSRLYITTPCQWLMNRVEKSMLAAGCVESRVIPYGLNLDIFKPDDLTAARTTLNLPQDALILLFSGAGFQKNPFKDYATMRGAVAEAARRLPHVRLIFLALGDAGQSERIGDHAEIRFVPFESDIRRVAAYYQAADVYLHAARADTFPNAVLEALACGCPVIGSAVGGIPEQIIAGETGLLVPPQDVEAMADAIERLALDSGLRQRMGAAAAANAKARFDVHRQVSDHLAWYGAVLGLPRST